LALLSYFLAVAVGHFIRVVGTRFIAVVIPSMAAHEKNGEIRHF
jgi:hypothetical protein